MNKCRKIKLDDNYEPLPAYQGDEIYNNGIFNFNISRILEHIAEGKLKPEREIINVKNWFRKHFRSLVTKDQVHAVDINKPVIQAEIRPGMFEIIDGNHRMEIVYRDGVQHIDSYKLKGEWLLPFFTDRRGYEAFVEYWNSKL